MKNILILCILICLTTVNSLMKPLKKSTPKSQQYVAKDLRQKSYKMFPNLKIPNKQFCEDRPLKPAEHYLVLPWWYHYCETFMEKKSRKYNNGVYYLPLYRKILDKLQVYKRNKMMQQQGVLRKQMKA